MEGTVIPTREEEVKSISGSRMSDRSTGRCPCCLNRRLVDLMKAKPRANLTIQYQGFLNCIALVLIVLKVTPMNIGNINGY